jgi:hypothetical protein
VVALSGIGGYMTRFSGVPYDDDDDQLLDS